MIFTAVPLATVGGVLLLWMRDMPFSVSAGIGFIALFGIAVLNGIVLIEHLKELKHSGMTNMRELILTGTKNRLRPVILTAAAAAMGFLPMAISTGAGAEVQRPLATVVIGGLITSTLLTMIALPLLFEIFNTITGFRFRPFGFIRSKSLVLGFVFLLPAAGTFGQSGVLGLDEIIQKAIENNKELNVYALKIKESEAYSPAAFTIDKTLVYYGYDENNIAENGYPLKVFGVEQNFNFPTVYTSQKKANNNMVSIAETDFSRQKILLTKQVSQAYYEIVYLQQKQNIYLKIDSLYQALNKNATISYQQGDIGYLDVLNTKAKQQQISTLLNQSDYDVKIGYERLALLVQSDSVFTIGFQELDLIPVKNTDIETNPGLQILKMQSAYQDAMLQVERNRLLPDLSLSYFNGTNNYASSKHYQGFQVGLGLPLFFGEQRAKIRANQVALDINSEMQAQYFAAIKAKNNELNAELMKYKGMIDSYFDSGKALSDQIIASSQKSYEMGEIDFFRFVMSIENALELKINYLENVAKYNQVVLEINYLTN